MAKILEVLADTPLATILVVAGIVFLLLSVAGKLTDKLTVVDARKKQALYLGLVLLGAGMFLSQSPGASAPSLASVPAPSLAPSSASDTASPTPAGGPTAPIAPATAGVNDTDWAAVEWSQMTPDQRDLWAKLGWTAESWSDSSPAPASQSISFDNLSPDQQKAVTLLGYTSATWDDK